jgi:hypothetical protein
VTSFGYPMMTEQARPDQLVADVVAAEAAGFEFSVCSDHFQPWLAEQGHAGGPDVEEHVEKIRPFIDAGFTEVALVQIGGEHQEPFLRWAHDELLPALRSL